MAREQPFREAEQAPLPPRPFSDWTPTRGPLRFFPALRCSDPPPPGGGRTLTRPPAQNPAELGRNAEKPGVTLNCGGKRSATTRSPAVAGKLSFDVSYKEQDQSPHSKTDASRRFNSCPCDPTKEQDWSPLSRRRLVAVNLKKAVETTKNTKDTKREGVAAISWFTQQVSFFGAPKTHSQPLFSCVSWFISTAVSRVKRRRAPEGSEPRFHPQPVG